MRMKDGDKVVTAWAERASGPGFVAPEEEPVTPPYESLLRKLPEEDEEDEDGDYRIIRVCRRVIDYEVFMRVKSRPRRLAAREILVSVLEHYRAENLSAYDHRGGERLCRG